MLCILYNNAEYKKYDETTVVSKAEKRILTKSDKALRGVTMCLLGILKHDVAKFNEGLPILLKNYNRIGLLNESEKAIYEKRVEYYERQKNKKCRHQQLLIFQLTGLQGFEP